MKNESKEVWNCRRAAWLHRGPLRFILRAGRRGGRGVLVDSIGPRSNSCASLMGGSGGEAAWDRWTCPLYHLPTSHLLLPLLLLLLKIHLHSYHCVWRRHQMIARAQTSPKQMIWINTELVHFRDTWTPIRTRSCFCVNFVINNTMFF